MRIAASLRLLALVLIALAFASGTGLRAAPTVAEARLEAYQLQGGLLADLCNEKSPAHPHAADCALCHLLAAGDLPPRQTSLIRIERALVASVILPRIQRAEAHRHDPAIPTRGPPHA